MSDRYEQTIGNAVAKAAPALAGAGASATFLGLGADQWALLASVATFVYVVIQIVLCLPKLITMARATWRRFFPKPDPTEAAAADE